MVPRAGSVFREKDVRRPDSALTSRSNRTLCDGLGTYLCILVRFAAATDLGCYTVYSESTYLMDILYVLNKGYLLLSNIVNLIENSNCLSILNVPCLKLISIFIKYSSNTYISLHYYFFSLFF